MSVQRIPDALAWGGSIDFRHRLCQFLRKFQMMLEQGSRHKSRFPFASLDVKIVSQ